MKIHSEDINAQNLRSYPGLEDMTDPQVEQASRDLRTLARIVFNQMIRTRADVPKSKAA